MKIRNEIFYNVTGTVLDGEYGTVISVGHCAVGLPDSDSDM